MSNAQAIHTPSQLKTIRMSIGMELLPHEFDVFMEAAKGFNLDPFRKQIIPFITNKSDEKKRRMIPIVTRDGFRVIASRCGDYRPASKPATIEIDESLKCPNNPKGLVKISVNLWKRDVGGEWFEVSGEAYWDEFAPLKEKWVAGSPSGEFYLERSGQWGKMPIVMLTKCAESQALRAGWPETYAGLYFEEEMVKAFSDETASEALEKHTAAAREKLVNKGQSVLFTFSKGGKMERVEIGQAHDRCAEAIQNMSDQEAFEFKEINAESFKEFWAVSPNDALAVKALYEPKVAAFEAALKQVAV